MPEIIAEFLGTFFLVVVGVGSILGLQTAHLVSPLTVDIAFGAIIAVGVFAFGHVSGAHFNPAVTLGLWSSGAFPGARVLGYLVAQFLAATLASLFLDIIYGTVAAGVTLPASASQIGAAFLVEFVGTYLLVTAIYATAIDQRATKGFAGLAIGGAILLAGLFGGAISGASVNPARSFGPALVSGNFQDYWIYLVAPILGSLAAANIYRRFIMGERPKS